MPKLLIDRVSNFSCLKRAWSEIKHRPDSYGFDGVKINEFERNLRDNLKKIQQEVSSGNYKFTPLRGIAKPKDTPGKFRPLKVPAIRDRVFQKAVELSIKRYIKKKYKIENKVSFAYREKLSVKDAVLKVRELYKSGYTWVYQGDIEKFFDKVNVDLLLEKIESCLPDESLNKLLRDLSNVELGNTRYLIEYLGEEDFLKIFPPAGSGIPQGGTLSPLFANVYLNELDMAMISRRFQMVRYADDFLVMCKSEEEARQADALAREIVEDKLKLTIYPLKPSNSKEKHSSIQEFHEIDFLGIAFRGSSIFPSGEKFEKAIVKMKKLAHRLRQGSLLKKLNILSEYVNTWGANYYYTDFNKGYYKALDGHLLKSTEEIMNHCGYRLVAKKNPIKILHSLGLRSFTQSYSYYKTLKQSSASSDKIV